MKNLFFIASIFIIILFLHTRVDALSGQNILVLRDAGISEETIQMMIEEKIHETRAFSIEEIISLKAAGLSDAFIRNIIREGSFQNRREPIIYGQDIRSIKFITVNDIIKLRDSGVSEEIIRTIIVSTSEKADEVEKENAWKMLQDMGIILDNR